MMPPPDKEVCMEAVRKGELFAMVPTEDHKYTTADIEALQEGERAELVDGRMYMMASPNLNHQEILGWLHAEIFNYIREHGGKCRVLCAPFGVFIRKDDKNYLEPDISVICDKDKLDQKGCYGAPDWVIEIVSPSSRWMDYRIKLPIYQETGVREYWIIDYDRQEIMVYRLQEGTEPEKYHFFDKVSAGLYDGFTIDFSQLLKYMGVEM